MTHDHAAKSAQMLDGECRAFRRGSQAPSYPIRKSSSVGSNLGNRRPFEEKVKRLLPSRFYYPRKIAKEAKRNEPELEILRDIVPVSHTAVDIGANRGYYSYALSAMASHVVAFEPNPELAEFAAAKLGTNVQVHQIALSNQQGTGTLYVPLNKKGNAQHLLGSLGRVHPAEAHLKIEVRLERLDNYCLDDVGFIKIDAEGSEMDIIEGAQDTILRFRPAMLIELCAGTFPSPIEHIERINANFGYDAWIVMNGGERVQASTVLSGGRKFLTRNVLFLPRS